MSDLKVGDVVRLKSGGPLMTVNQIGTQQYSDSKSAWCDWFDKTKNQKGVFPLTSLEVYEDD